VAGTENEVWEIHSGIPSGGPFGAGGGVRFGGRSQRRGGGLEDGLLNRGKKNA